MHYYGAHSLSFADEVLLAEGDVMAIQFGGFSLALLGSKGRMGIEVTNPDLQRGFSPQLDALDADFASPLLCHPGYGLVFLFVRPREAAEYVRRVLRHPQLNTQAKRMGTYVRASYDGVRVWRRNAAEQAFPWPQAVS